MDVRLAESISRNYGSLEHPHAFARTNGPCGEILEISLRISSGKIVDARFRTTGCVNTVKTTACILDQVRGKTVRECLGLKPGLFLQWISRDHEHSVRHGIITLKRALRDYAIRGWAIPGQAKGGVK